jgi:thiol-disulfide isomerase/thioredoxin
MTEFDFTLRSLPLLVLPFLCAAQPSDPAELSRQINRQQASVPAGAVMVQGFHVSAIEADTTWAEGRLMFWRQDIDTDSIGKFVVQLADGQGYAYDGRKFYWVNPVQKEIRLLGTEGESAAGIIRTEVSRGLLLPAFFLSAKPPIRGFGIFDSVYVRPGQRPDQLELVVSDTFANEKMIPEAPDVATFRRVYVVDAASFEVRQVEEMIQAMPLPQYRSHRFSAVRPLAAGHTFERAFPLDSLERIYGVAQSGATRSREGKPMIGAGQLLPEFSLPDLDGAVFDGASGRKGLLLLDFWYRGCLPCNRAFPFLERLHRKYSDRGLTVLGVNPYDRDAEKIRKFLQERSVSYPSVLDAKAAYAALLGVSGYPSLLLVDRHTNRVLVVHTGFNEAFEADLEQRIEAFLR